MSNFAIEDEGDGTFVLINHDTGQRTTYATRTEAEEAKKHLSAQEGSQSQAGGTRSGQRPNPDEDQDQGRRNR